MSLPRLAPGRRHEKKIHRRIHRKELQMANKEQKNKDKDKKKKKKKKDVEKK
jgi:hypothetical protein